MRTLHLFLLICLTAFAQTRPVPPSDIANTSTNKAAAKAAARSLQDTPESAAKKVERLAKKVDEGAGSPVSTVKKEHKEHGVQKHTKHSPPPPELLPPPPESSSGSYFPMLAVGALIVCCLCVVLQCCIGGVSSYWSSMSSYGTQIGSFVVLVCVQSVAILLFKLCQTSGSYSFSPASCVAMTEACKLALAVTLHSRHVKATGVDPFKGVTLRICAHYFFLAVLYTINNQLTFYALELVDPGTFTLAKSLAPYIVALMLRVLGQRLNELQWVCVLLQCICIAVSQYDACKARGMVPTHGYVVVAVATVITAVSSVWNQQVVKNFDVTVHLQNTILYVFGFSIAIFSYLVMPPRPGAVHVGFFEGYTTLALLLVLFQAFHGLAVTLVYKYADAIVKNFANSAVMAVLVIVSANFFGVATTLHSWLGVAGVLVTTYAYMNIALKM